MNKSQETDLLKGDVCEQFVVCGKPTCRCSDGERHGPYYYRVWRHGARIQKQYVSKANVETVREACEAYKQVRNSLRDRNARRVELSNNLTRTFRKTMRIHKPAANGGRATIVN